MKQYRCKLDSFTCESPNGDRMCTHIERVHGLKFQVYDDPRRRREMQKTWMDWWRKNVEVQEIV